MLAQLSTAQIELANLQSTGVSSISQVIQQPVHTEWLLTETLKTYATTKAVEANINVDGFLATIQCESKFDPLAVGDGGTSYGIVQLHLPAHPDISKEMALDPFFSLAWAAEQFAQGRAWMWTCWKKRMLS